MRWLLLLALGLSSCGGSVEPVSPPPRAPSQAAAVEATRARRYQVVSQKEISGACDVATGADGRERIDCAWINNGRGPKIHAEVRFAADSTPLEPRVTGTDTFGVGLDETFAVESGSARWASHADRGETTRSGPAFYLPASPLPPAVGSLAKAAIAAGGRLALLPSGEVRVEHETDAIVHGRSIHCHALLGMDFTPVRVWLDDKCERSRSAWPGQFVAAERAGAPSARPHPPRRCGRRPIARAALGRGVRRPLGQAPGRCDCRGRPARSPVAPLIPPRREKRRPPASRRATTRLPSRSACAEDVMTMMKAAVCMRYGPPEVLQMTERERPTPRDDEVLVRVRAASVTDSDIFIRSGRVGWTLMIPFRLMMGITRPRRAILGEVIAGEVVGTGAKVRRLKAGDQVYGLTGFSLGAYAEYACLKGEASKQGGLARKPSNVTFEEATALAYGGSLALQALEKGGIRRGDRVLIYGAAGTSGTFAVQYAKHLGAKVTGVCSAAKTDLVRSLGADRTIDYRSGDAVSQLEQYDLVLDAVGKRRKSALREACTARAPKGRLVSIDDGPLVISVARLDQIRELAEAGAIRPITDRCYPLEQLVEAHRYVEIGHKTGNVAITIDGGALAAISAEAVSCPPVPMVARTPERPSADSR